jgi:hypothetical protein
MENDDKNIVDKLEFTIDEAIERVVELKTKNQILLEEKQEQKALLAEKELRIEGLQKVIEELKTKMDDKLIQRYKDKEETLRQRIQALLSKLEELKLQE